MFDGIIRFLKHRKARRMMERRGLIGGRRRHHEESDPTHSADRSVVLGTFMLILIWGVCSLLLTLSILRAGPPTEERIFYAGRFMDLVREEESMVREAVFNLQLQKNS